jgi:DNA replicative helicase MCM subunit Mcm2 (Cdc46/Mcm family)
MDPNSKLNILEQDIVDHLLARKEKELVRLLEQPADCHRSLFLDGHELLDMSDLVFMKLMLEPDKCLRKLDSLLGVALTRLHQAADSERRAAWGPPNDRVHLRIRSLPDLPEFQRLVVPRSEDVGSFISLAGTVTKTGPAKMLTTKKLVSCTRCRHSFHILADFEQVLTSRVADSV